MKKGPFLILINAAAVGCCLYEFTGNSISVAAEVSILAVSLVIGNVAIRERRERQQSPE